jgi:hypothetical protein
MMNSLQEAIDAIKAGQTATGKRLLIGVLQSDPFNESAWLWMSSVYTSLDQRRMCLRRVLEINPNNETAKRGLANLDPSISLPAVRSFERSSPPATADVVVPITPVNKPIWSEQAKFQATRRWFFFLVASVIGLWLALISWVFFTPSIDVAAQPLPSSASVLNILAPLLVASAAIERFLETVFNIMESSWHTLVAYFGRGLRWLKSAEAEVERSRQWLADVSNFYNDELNHLGLTSAPTGNLATIAAMQRLNSIEALLTTARQRLETAEKQLADLTESSSYKSAKATAAIILGLMIGVAVAKFSALQMFALLGIGMPTKIDIFITGLIAGSGTYPVHSLVDLLQQVKDVIDSTRRTIKPTESK